MARIFLEFDADKRCAVETGSRTPTLSPHPTSPASLLSPPPAHLRSTPHLPAFIGWRKEHVRAPRASMSRAVLLMCTIPHATRADAHTVTHKHAHNERTRQIPAILIRLPDRPGVCVGSSSLSLPVSLPSMSDSPLSLPTAPSPHLAISPPSLPSPARRRRSLSSRKTESKRRARGEREREESERERRVRARGQESESER